MASQRRRSVAALFALVAGAGLALQCAGALSLIGIAIAALPIGFVSAAYADLVSTYPSADGTLLPLERALGPGWARLFAFAMVLSLVALSGTMLAAGIDPVVDRHGGMQGLGVSRSVAGLIWPGALALVALAALWRRPRSGPTAPVDWQPLPSRILATALVIGAAAVFVALCVAWDADRFASQSMMRAAFR